MNQDLKCKHCERVCKRIDGLKQHEKSCIKNSKRIQRSNAGKTTWNKGVKMSSTFCKNTSNGMLNSNKVTGRGATLKVEEERKRKISETMKAKKLGGHRKGSGRGKKGWYKGYWCDSSWELAWLIYQLDHQIKVIRNTKSFEYVFENESHKYYPDFIIEDVYFEIKGYKTSQSEEKIKQFPLKLEVVDSKKIKPFLDYAIEKYGKDFIEVYER